jgi:hypothetical protein
MLMLTHTYILQDVLGRAGIKSYDLDIFVYNIIPDLLTIHPDIHSGQTHKIKRLLQVPDQYHKAAYVMFHLIVDDLAHYGSICSDIPVEFDPDSQGYSYIKGKPIIQALLNYHKAVNQEISYNEAVYRSHLIVEMIYDLVILDHINSDQSIQLLAEAIYITAESKMDEFVATVNWLYNIAETDIRDVIKKASLYLTAERMQHIMNMEGRIRLYADKFGLRSADQFYFDGIKDLFVQARNLLNDDELFISQTAKAINKSGWLPPIR